MTDEMIPFPILRTKLHRPPVTGDLVPRCELVAWLHRHRRQPLTLVSAPAGYGKTTLVSHWIDTWDRPTAWLSLDEQDDDLAVFLTYVTAALRTLFPAACRDTLALLNARSLPPLAVLVRRFSNDLEALEGDVTLVLDDYHVIHDMAIHDLLNEVLRHPPRRVHLVLVTRRDPPLSLATLRARDRLTELRQQDLRFTVAETTMFLEQLTGLEVVGTVAATLHAKTEGWVTGLRLAALFHRHQGNLDQLLNHLPEHMAYVSEYFMTEVLSQLPPGIRQYLLATAILDRFCVPLCEAVWTSGMGPEASDMDGGTFIIWLQRHELFLIVLDTEHHWFRYHHLFQAFLRKQLAHHCSPEQIAALHARASAWLEENGLIDEAIQHALAAGDSIHAARLVQQHRHAVQNVDQWHVLERWLSRFPEALKQQRPELLLAMAWIANKRHQLEEISRIIERIEALVDDPTTAPVGWGELNLFKGIIAYWQGQGERSLHLITEAQDQIPEGHDYVRAEMEVYFGFAHQMIGQQEKAVQALHEKSQSHCTQEAIILTRQIATLSFIHLLTGALQPAAREAERLGRVGKGSSLDHGHNDIWSAYLQGCCCFQTYNLARAHQYLSLVAEQKYYAHTAMAISGLAGLALTYQAMQQTTNANHTIDEMIDFAHETNNLYNLHMAHSCQARLSLLRGEVKTAKQWLETFDEAPDAAAMSFFLEIPSITQCRVLIGMGSNASLNEAARRLERLWEATQVIHNTFQMIEIGVLRAQALQRMSRLEEALAILDHVVTLSAPGGWIRPYVELDSPMAELLKRLRTHHPAVDYIDEILAAFEHTQDDMGLTVGNSPTPPAPSSSAPPLDEPLTTRELDILELFDYAS